MVYNFKGGFSIVNSRTIRKGRKVIGLYLNEIEKNIKIIFRGPTRTILIICVIFPLLYLAFMNMIFGVLNFNFPMAVVIPDYTSDEELHNALDSNYIPNTVEFLNYLNNNSVVGQTIVKSHITATGISLEQFEEELKLQKLSLIVKLPLNFDNIIAQVKNGTWTNGSITIELHILNIHEDYTKNIYFGFQRKLKAYYDDVLFNETEVAYIYLNTDPNRVTFPRMWTIGSGALVFLCLTSSMIIAASFIFNEKTNLMRQEFALASSKNQMVSFFGKLSAASIVTFGLNFIIGMIIIFFWIGLPIPIDILGFLGITLITIVIGALFGSILGALIPEQVFTVPTATFIALTSLFLCGGFMDVQLFNPILQSIVQWIPFTYCYAIFKNTLLTGDTPPLSYVAGIILYITIFTLLGLYLYRKFVISSK
jgi:ABC-type multidrug transport system permease subunit